MEIKKAISVLQNSRFWDFADGAPEDVTTEFCDAVDTAIVALNCVSEVSAAISRIGNVDTPAETKRDVVEFVSYDGRFPNLCSGTLVLRINGKTYSYDHCLVSGGCVSFDHDWNEDVSQGPWSVRLPSELDRYREEIERLVNEHVPHGCCGGCV